MQVVFGQPENQPHQADVAKRSSIVVLAGGPRDSPHAVRRRRRAGVGRTLLVLDTASGDAERLYERLGWTRVGQVPGYYALMPDGRPCDITIFYKPIAQT